jgi:hypothetical protein
MDVSPKKLEQGEAVEPKELRDLSSLPYLKGELQRMNDRFIAAMAAAIRARLERPPRVGIDLTPGTKNPSHVPHGASNRLWRRQPHRSATSRGGWVRGRKVLVIR